MKNKRVAVAMSGGVDSSLVAARLLEQGYDVFGVTMLLFDTYNEDRVIQSAAVTDAKTIANQLGIAHYVLDYRDRFKKQVMDYFIQSYAEGITPNPCVVCNEEIKFGAMWESAQELGADFLATGHYVQNIYSPDLNRYEVHKGADARKDQSYVMYHMKQSILPHILFPLGNLHKEDTREAAKKYGLPVYNKPESQDICFIPNNDYTAFLRQYIPQAFAPGDIVDLAGQVLGQHKGLPSYTVGQRKGLGIASAQPLYVVALDAKRNRLIVGPQDYLFAKTVKGIRASFIDFAELQEPMVAEAKIRYAAKPAICRIIPTATGVDVLFEEPQRAVTPGQSVVFYDGTRVLGGAIIAENPLFGEDHLVN